MDLYYVVEFPDEDKVAVVPSKWMSMNDEFCYWPRSLTPQQVSTAIVKRVDTQDGWSKHRATVLYKTEQYLKARRKCREAETQSDVASSAAEGSPKKRKRYVPLRLGSPASSESSENDEVVKDVSRSGEQECSVPPFPIVRDDTADRVAMANLPTPSPGTSAHATTSCMPAPRNLIQKKNHQSGVSDADPGTEDPGDKIWQNQSTDTKAFQNVVLKRLARIEQTLDHSCKLLASISAENVEKMDIPVKMPVEAMDDFDKLDAWLETDKNFSYLAQAGKIVGGRSSGEATRRVLEKFIANSLALKFNWAGKAREDPPKRAFKHTRMVNLVIDTVTSMSGITSTTREIEESIKNWFRFAKDRDGGRTARAKAAKPNQTI